MDPLGDLENMANAAEMPTTAVAERVASSEKEGAPKPAPKRRLSTKTTSAPPELKPEPEA